MVLPQLPDSLLLPGIILGPDNIVHPPFIAGGSAEHTAHKMIVAVRMGESMEGIVLVHPELFRGNKDGSAGSQGDVASSFSHCAGSHGGSRIVSGPCHYFYCFRDSKLGGYLRLHRAYRLIALIHLCHLLFPYAADLQHFLGPAAVFHIKQKHSRGI